MLQPEGAQPSEHEQQAAIQQTGLICWLDEHAKELLWTSWCIEYKCPSGKHAIVA